MRVQKQKCKKPSQKWKKTHLFLILLMEPIKKEGLQKCIPKQDRSSFTSLDWNHPLPILETSYHMNDLAQLFYFLLEFLKKSDYKNGCGSLGWLEVRLASCNLIKFTESTNSYLFYVTLIGSILQFKQYSWAIPHDTIRNSKPNTDTGTNRWPD